MPAPNVGTADGPTIGSSRAMDNEVLKLCHVDVDSCNKGAIRLTLLGALDTDDGDGIGMIR